MTADERLATGLHEHRAGHLSEAEAIYRELISAEPTNAQALHSLAVLLYESQRPAEAVDFISRAISLRPNDAEFHRTLGTVLRTLGRLEEAADSFRRALDIQPDFAAALNGLGIACRALGRFDQAITCFKRAIGIEPTDCHAYSNLGNALRDAGRLSEAREAFLLALSINPDFAEAHNNLAAVCRDQREPHQAIKSWHRAIELKPDYAEAHNNLGHALIERGQLDEALLHIQRALQLRPNHAESHLNLGSIAGGKGNLPEAIKCYRRALDLDPAHAEAHMSCGMAQLALEDYSNGWREYEWRLKTKNAPRHSFSQPVWDGSIGPDRTLLILAEQGFGDTFQFIRYAPVVRSRVRRVVVLCEERLRSILEGTSGIDLLVTDLNAAPPFDAYVPLLSLPGIMRTDADSIPADVPYLSADPGLVDDWQTRLAAVSAFRIGISWQGNPAYLADLLRSVPLRHFRHLAAASNVQLISLQKGPGVDQLAVNCDFRVEELGPDLDEASGAFMDTAAVMRNLDLCVTSDTAVAHLAGALGIRVWLALPFSPDWRWQLHREDSPWYPTMRLFRQRRRGDWDDVFRRMRAALDQLIEAAEPSRPAGIPSSSASAKSTASVKSAASVKSNANVIQQLTRALDKQRAGQLAEAEAAYREILKDQPHDPDALHLLGVLLHQQGDHETAVELIRSAIAIKPDWADFHRNLGSGLRSLGQYDAAIASFRRALELKPDAAGTLNALGIAYRQSGRMDEAIACLQRALKLAPDYHVAHNTLGNALREQGDLAGAEACYRQALSINPDQALTHNNLGTVLRDQGQLDAAAICFEQAIQLSPQYAQAYYNRGMLRLQLGDFASGWQDYEWRWQANASSALSKFERPRWQGERLPDKTVLIHTEQGLGDTLQFARYAKLVKQRVGRVIFLVQRPLVQLLAGLRGVDLLVTDCDPLPDYDLHTPLLSLPGLLGTSLDTIPDAVPYLTPRPELGQLWRDRLAPGGGFRIGISWQGNPDYFLDRVRSIPLRAFRSLAEVPGVRLISLQKGQLPSGEGVDPLDAEVASQLEELGPDFDESSGAFMDTAAVMRNLDLCISADTATAHLAGALGVPVWLAVSSVSDWRWLTQRTDSPWYPTMRIFRQQREGDWDGVFAQIRCALDELVRDQ